MLQGQEKYVTEVPFKSEAQNECVEILDDVHTGPRPLILTPLSLLSETLPTLFIWSLTNFENGKTAQS